MNIEKVSEKMASQYALAFLREYAGDEIFLGSDIEQILAEKAIVIYQDVEDPEYFGAMIRFMNQSLIAINTRQTLRSRYYSAAHELWHLQYELGELGLTDSIVDFDHERAADHFAATVMLPERLISNLIQHFNGDLKVLVIRIADVSSMPYVAVVRRLKERGKKIPKNLFEKSEKDWLKIREELGIAPNILDKMDVFTQFNALTTEVTNKLKRKEITLEVAANLLKYSNPEKAESYWKERQNIKDDWLSDD